MILAVAPGPIVTEAAVHPTNFPLPHFPQEEKPITYLKKCIPEAQGVNCCGRYCILP